MKPWIWCIKKCYELGVPDTYPLIGQWIFSTVKKTNDSQESAGYDHLNTTVEKSSLSPQGE